MTTATIPGGDGASLFEANRKFLLGLAYRMLGSLAEAEDVVQDSYLRWQAADRKAVASPRAFLSTIATRLSLDRLKSARAQREQYVGPWLPEPIVDEGPLPGEAIELADDLSYSLLLALERLSPLERAAFLLHDVFDLDYGEVAEALQRSEASCRQLAARARKNIRAARPRYRAKREEAERLATAFLKASREGDAEALKSLLAEEVELHTDGGGLRPAALNVISGRDKIIAFFSGFARKGGGVLPEILHVGVINAAPGIVTLEPDGLPQTTALEVEDGRIKAIYVVRNPEKLRQFGTFD
ncbi:sigma-70 family RNA polymerase sigma factor [Sphingosinicella humi]|uniref:RNA polymerase sigma factor SigJ n=1 Tax=Allosphingosinicella humi TaxID=2068657 RepID=A0A2U2J211_9SPHN|nr:sigma-70 family RNA polymerase sigma factor [Sphingosinicella humi]PWG02311.1 RNA polymerase sigma factor SigJ [Sphingosinicella humi]